MSIQFSFAGGSCVEGVHDDIQGERRYVALVDIDKGRYL